MEEREPPSPIGQRERTQRTPPATASADRVSTIELGAGTPGTGGGVGGHHGDGGFTPDGGQFGKGDPPEGNSAPTEKDPGNPSPSPNPKPRPPIPPAAPSPPRPPIPVCEYGSFGKSDAFPIDAT